MKKIKWLIRFMFWVLSGFGFFEKQIYFIGGWDTLHPFSPYSFGGLKRKDFFELRNKIKDKEIIGIQTVNLLQYGDLHQLVTREKFLEVQDRSRIVYQYFLSPWKKNYNYN